MNEFTGAIGEYISGLGADYEVSAPFGDFPECTLFCSRDRIGNNVGIVAIPRPDSGTCTDIFSATLLAESMVFSMNVLRKDKKVIVIHEDLWRRNRTIAEGKISVHLGYFRKIMARDCAVMEISSDVCRDFLERNHSYGYTACKYRYGLFGTRDRDDVLRKGELVGVATFSGGRRWIKPEGEIVSYEWIRYASAPDVRINGGMTKLLDAFIVDVRPDDIMSYADLECADSGSYASIGFIAEGYVPHQGYLVGPDNKREPLKRLSEAYIAERLLEGSYPVFNFGSRKYRLRL